MAETEAFLWRVIYTIQDLTRNVRGVEDHVPMKVRFSFIHESIAEMALFNIYIYIYIHIAFE